MKRTLSLLLALLTLTPTACAADSAPVQLFAINVGKADALLLSAGEEMYLIDTGTAEGWGMLSCALATLQVKHLTGVILTHTDKDHGGGAEMLATSSMPVDAWYAPAYYTDVKESKHPAVKAAELRGTDVTWLHAGDVLPLGDGTLDVLGPVSASEKENCNSLVLLAQAGGGRMLLAGDMEFPEENELLSAGVIPSCAVLKVGNHGEDDATSEALVRQVRPEIAVISTNTQEEPDTPSVRVMQLLRTFGAQVYQTQHATAGVLVTMEDGQARAQMMDYGAHPTPPKGISLADRDPKEDHIRICNDGTEAVDLSGWYLRSDRGGEQFVLPSGTMLAAGESLLVATLSSDRAGDVLWPEKKVWHKSKDDAAYLYDRYGQIVAFLE